MKKINIYKLILFNFVLLCSCSNAEYSPIDKAIYFTDAENKSSISLTLEGETKELPITVRSVKKLSSKATVQCRIDKEVLEDYNKLSGMSLKMLPEGSYTIPENFTIESGQFISASKMISINPLTEEMRNSGEKFALPLRIVSDNELLPSSSTLVVTIDEVIITPVISLRSQRGSHGEEASGPMIKFPIPGPMELPEWTVEFRFNKSRIELYKGRHQAMFVANGNGGLIFTTIGWPFNKLFLRLTGGGSMNSNTILEADKWYHVAIVSDGITASLYMNGKFDNKMPAPAGPQGFSNLLKFGNKNLRQDETVQVSEFRFWGVARSANDIKFNMFNVNPSSEGLIGYWKLNEGKGLTFKNYADGTMEDAYLTTSGQDTAPKFTGTPEWIFGVRSDWQ